MAEVDQVINDNITNEPALEGAKISAEVQGGSFLKRRKVLRLYGTVHSELQKKKAYQIAEHAAGDNFDIHNELVVK